MRAKLLLGSSYKQKTYWGRTWMRPFQTSLQPEERALLVPHVRDGYSQDWEPRSDAGGLWETEFGEEVNQPWGGSFISVILCNPGSDTFLDSILVRLATTLRCFPSYSKPHIRTQQNENDLCPRFPNGVPRCHKTPQPTQRGPLRYFQCFEGNSISSGCCDN